MTRVHQQNFGNPVLLEGVASEGSVAVVRGPGRPHSFSPPALTLLQ